MSDARGITAEGNPKVRKNAANTAAKRPSVSLHFERANCQATAATEITYAAPARRSRTPARAPHNKSTHATSAGLSNQTSR